MLRQTTLNEKLQLATSQVLEESYKRSRERILPWKKERDSNQWIEDMRHEKSAEIVQRYLTDTKDIPNLHLLREAGRDLLRIQKDQKLTGTSTQQLTDFMGPEDYWWGQGSFLESVGDKTSFYLLYGCKADEKQTVHVMKSLGWHDKRANLKVNNAREHFQFEYNK